MSWHRFRVLQCADDFTRDNVKKKLTFRCVGSSGTEVRKSALKKSKELCNSNRCENLEKKKNNFFTALRKSKQYKIKKICTFKPDDKPEIPSCSEHLNLFWSSENRTKLNKRTSTDCKCPPDARVKKKRTRFTEATGLRSPCSILSLQSKNGQGNPYIQYYASNNGTREAHQTIDYYRARSIADSCKAEGNIDVAMSTRAKDVEHLSRRIARKKSCLCIRNPIYTDSNETTTPDCQPHIKSCISDLYNNNTHINNKAVCTNESSCKLRVDKTLQNTQNNKKIKNKKTSVACKCVDVTTNTCRSPEFSKVIKRICVVDKATSTQDKSGCSIMMRARRHERQNSKRYPKFQNRPYPSIYAEDETTGNFVNTGCSNTNMISRMYGYESTEWNKRIMNKTSSGPCEHYADAAAGTDDKSGCSKIIRPELRACEKPKWYEHFRKKISLECKYRRDVSTSTNAKILRWKSKIIRPRVRECINSRWDRYLGKKTRPCTCYLDNCEIYKCQKSKWKRFFRKNICKCYLDVDRCGGKAHCQRFRTTAHPCYVDAYDGALLSSSVCGINEDCIKPTCHTSRHQVGKIVIHATPVTSETSMIILEPSNKCEKNRDFVCYPDPCQSNKCENTDHPCCMEPCQPSKSENRDFPCYPQSSQQVNTNSTAYRCRDVGVTTSLSLLHAILHRRKKCEPCYRPQITLRCIRCKLRTCFEHVVIATVAVCCAPCLLVAVTYWFLCYLFTASTNNCKQTDESCRTPTKFRGTRFLVDKCNGIKKSYRNDKSFCFDEHMNTNTPTKCEIVPFDEKGIGCLPKSCIKKNNSICTEEANVFNKKIIRVSRRCKKRSRSCPNPHRKYNLYYVKERGWVIKPVASVGCGGGDNNLSTEAVSCDNPDQNVCLQQEGIFCNASNYAKPCTCYYCSCPKTCTRGSGLSCGKCICKSECNCPKLNFSEMDKINQTNQKGPSNQKGFFSRMGFYNQQKGNKVKRGDKEQSGWRRAFGISKTETGGSRSGKQYRGSDQKTSQGRSSEDFMDDACRKMLKELIAPLQPSAKRTFREISGSAGRFCKYIWITCLCCPCVFCLYCCHRFCMDLSCSIFC